MALKVLIAGCPEDERGRLETLVRSAIGRRANEGSWNVSLVRIGAKWSARLEGPHEALRNVSFMAAAGDELHEGILDALRRAGMAAPTAPATDLSEAPRPSEARRDSHSCATCGKGFVVIYDSYRGESQRNVPVACPHCWQLNQVPVSQYAATGEEYRAEKA